MAATSDFLAIAEGLHHLDPVRTYPRRAAKLVASLAGASAFRVEIEGEESSVESVPPPDPSHSCVTIPLRHGRHVLGVLYLYPAQGSKLEAPDLRLARWGARALARGLTYSSRMTRHESRRRGTEVASRLERTPLTRREKEVVALLVSGAGTRQIAERTGLTVATVHTYLKRIYAKLGVHSRVELMARVTGTADSVPTGAEETEAMSAADTPVADDEADEADEEVTEELPRRAMA